MPDMKILLLFRAFPDNENVCFRGIQIALKAGNDHHQKLFNAPIV